MRFYPRKAPRKKADILVDKLASGKCDDQVVSELRVAIADISEPEELQRISWAVLDIAMNSKNYMAVAYSLKSILLFMPMGDDIENALDNRMLMLAEEKPAVANKPLIEAIARYIQERTAKNIDRSMPFIPALILLLEEGNGPAAAIAYEILQSAAGARSEFFEPYASLLTRELGSINNATRIYTARLITRLAATHPEYMAEAEKTLLHISTFYPDAEVKSAAAEAYQTITKNMVPPQPEQDYSLQPRHDSTGGLAEIMRKKATVRDKKQTDSRIDNRLLSLAANFARKSDMRNGQANGKPGAPAGDADNEAMDKIIDDFSEIAGVITGNQDEGHRAARPAAEEHFSKEEAELRDMVAKVQTDFSVSAESLLDSLGMGHLHKDQQKEAAASPAKAPQEEPEMSASTETAQVLPETSVDAAPAITPQLIEVEIVADQPQSDAAQSVANDDTDHREIIDSVRKIIGEVESDKVPAIPVVEVRDSAQSAGAIAAETPKILAAQEPEKAVAAAQPAQIVETTTTVAAPAEKEIPAVVSKAVKSPIIPEGVRMSAVKFRAIDQTRKQAAPAKVSIKPHIKPLNRTPRDINKMTQQRAQAAAANGQPTEAEAPAAKVDSVPASPEVGQQPKVENAEPTICPSCGEKLTGDFQYCVKCGADLKSQKFRCPRCGQINTRETNSCVRCGARQIRVPVAKQPDAL